MTSRTDGPLLSPLTYLEQAEEMVADEGSRNRGTARAAEILLAFSKAKSLQTIANSLEYICERMSADYAVGSPIAVAINNLATCMWEKR